MRFVIQRVKEASVSVNQQIIGEIGQGFLVLLGIGREDTREMADKMVKKLVGLRIFSDEQDKINLSLRDVDGSVLVVSQFTLYANCKKGNRPSFEKAGDPKLANELYEYIKDLIAQEIPRVECGEFAADMKVSLVNDGPFTIILDSDEICA